MEDSKSVPIGSPAGQNEPPVSIGSQTQPSEPIGDKNRITSLALKRAVFAGLGEDRISDVVWCESTVEYGREEVCLDRRHAVQNEGDEVM
jgi:hypothetical protein